MGFTPERLVVPWGTRDQGPGPRSMGYSRLGGLMGDVSRSCDFPKRKFLMDYISMLDGFLGEQNYQKRKYYIIRSWELISKKGYFDGLCKWTVEKYFQKKESQ